MKRLLFLLAGLACLSISTSAAASPGRATASVQILRAVTVTKTSDLLFGTVVPATSSATVSIARTGARSCSARLRCYGTPSAGRFHVVGASGQLVSIGLAATRITLADGASHSMTVTLSLSASSLTLVGGGADFSIGGALSVKANQAEGAYTGQYLVSVDYQ